MSFSILTDRLQRINDSFEVAKQPQKTTIQDTRIRKVADEPFNRYVDQVDKQLKNSTKPLPPPKGPEPWFVRIDPFNS